MTRDAGDAPGGAAPVAQLAHVAGILIEGNEE
jgi:hypothetical protein